MLFSINESIFLMSWVFQGVNKAHVIVFSLVCLCNSRSITAAYHSPALISPCHFVFLAFATFCRAYVHNYTHILSHLNRRVSFTDLAWFLVQMRIMRKEHYLCNRMLGARLFMTQ